MNPFYTTADAPLQPSEDEAIQRLAAEILHDIDSFSDDTQNKLTEDAVQHLVASYVERSGVLSPVPPPPYRASLSTTSHREPPPTPPLLDDYHSNIQLLQDMRSQREAQFTKHLTAISKDVASTHRDNDSSSCDDSDSGSSSGYSSDEDQSNDDDDDDADIVRPASLATLMDVGCQTSYPASRIDVGTSTPRIADQVIHRDVQVQTVVADPPAMSPPSVQPRCYFPCDLRTQAKHEASHMSVQTDGPAVKECGIMTSAPSLRDHGTAMSPKSAFVALLKTKAVGSAAAASSPCDFELDLSNLDWRLPAVP